MIAEALQFQHELSVRSVEPSKLVKTHRESKYAIGGLIREIKHDPAPREHAVKSLQEIERLATRFALEPDEGEADDTEVLQPVVWFSEERIVLVLDDADYRVETVTLNLEKSDVWRAVEGLKHGPKFNQKNFIKLLRVDLARTLESGVLLERVRKVRFENGSAVSGSVERGRESFGREILSKVETGGELPEEVVLQVPVFKTLGESATYPIRCAVEVDPSMGEFQLIPLPDEIERVFHLAMDSIRSRLEEHLPATVPCYYGTP